VKTNLVFFNKGKPTEKIWYFDLSDVKVGKKTPMTEGHFKEFFELLPARGDSPNAWTVDFAAKLIRALEEARPHREKAAELYAQAKELEDRWRERRKAKSVSEAGLMTLESQWKETERAGRESLAKGEAIENAVYDLKAVNPNRTIDEDKRTPVELLDFIAQKGLEADAALARLRALTPGV
jgi:type I restriction enzyme M protein